MSETTVFMFSGQGSQYLQMGRVLFDANPVFRRSMMQLDDLVQDLSGNSIIERLYLARGFKEPAFDRTLLTHPAIFMVEYSLAEALIRAGVIPDMTLGTSLGSFAAAAVAGAISVEDALMAVILQASALESACEPGGMIAVLAQPSLYGEEFLGGHCELAAVNLPSHFVVSAQRAQCAQIEAGLKAREVAFQRLPVSFAFHSRWIENARARFEAFMRSIRLTAGQLRIVCCEQATVLARVSHSFFWSVTRHPIRFPEAIANLEQTGRYRYIDAGPAGTLATFLKYLLPEGSGSTVHSILSPFARERQNWACLTGSAL